MTVFKTFLLILKKNKGLIILYTTILLVFGSFNMQANQSTVVFEASKPDVFIVNEDEEKGITKGFVDYIKNNSEIAEIQNTKEAIDDALFYEDVSLVVYIPQNFNNDFMNGNNHQITIKKADTYYSSFAEMLLQRYIKVATIYRETIKNEDELVAKVNETVSQEIDTEITTKLDTTGLTKAAHYFDFASYSFLACLIYIICIVLSTFNEEKVRKRITISSFDYKKHNRILMLGNSLYAIFLWALYAIMSFVMIGEPMKSVHGALFIINSLIFVICATSLSFFLGNLIKNKNAISGVVNVVALGSAFLCGAFVPPEWLPDFVKTIGHIFPAFYYIDSNQTIANLEEVNFDTLQPILINAGIVVAFTVVFMILTNIVTKKRRKV
ncbi:MAG: ABC transporter permease [Clostridia bacterium]|nr:ABC transporter permease [Clostridia bacterium]